MYKELERCIGELQVNHTDKEIAGALSEYFQIVKNVSEDYDDLATVMDIRADHPELGFMDDEEIEGILEQAETMRRKHKAAEGEYLAEGDMRDLFMLDPDWFDLGTGDQRFLIEKIETHAPIKTLARMVWICTSSPEITIDKIERTMRGYLEKRRAEERRSYGKEDACSYDVDFAEECIKAHMDAFEAWPYGNVKKIEADGDGDLRITYAGGMYWYYKKETGGIVWW